VDYLTKWIEVEAFASMTATEESEFVWKNIIIPFGIPQTMIFDNSQRFDTRSPTTLAP